MPTSDFPPHTFALMRRMTAPPPSHERFVGEAVDTAAIDSVALGDLWALAHATEIYEDRRPIQSVAAQTARLILALAEQREPVFRGAACRDFLELVARDAEAEPRHDVHAVRSRWPLERACFALTRCDDLSFEGLRPVAERLLAATSWQTMPHLAVALARLVDAACEARVLGTLAKELAESPLVVDELRAVTQLDLAANLTVADVAYPETLRTACDGGEARRLSCLALYAEFARTGLGDAAERVRQVHGRERPYAADKAFTILESCVIARLARVALARDEPWLPAVLEELFLNVSLAPTAARTVPSQSVSIALGHAIEAFPTPEALDILRRVIRDIRHAGVLKKLQRNVRGAELGLAARPLVALRLSNRSMNKADLGSLTRCLEAGLATEIALPFGDWRGRLAEHPQAGRVIRSLVWRMVDGSAGRTAVLPVLDRERELLHDVGGAIVEPSTDARVMLWHPSEASAAERSAWRDRLAELRIKQPFKQVFREHYVVSAEALAEGEIRMFSDHEVSIRPFLGVARREGWRCDDEHLVRAVAEWTATIDLSHPVFPGANGCVTIRRIRICVPARRRLVPVQLGEVPAVTLSEILRSVDLLVSTSGFAVEPDDLAEDDAHRFSRLCHLARLPLGPMAEMRRDALACALAGRRGMEGLTFDSRHLRLGRHAIHLATGRVTRDGDPITVDLPTRPKIGAVPWLPYDEQLLERIAVTALQIGQSNAT